MQLINNTNALPNLTNLLATGNGVVDAFTMAPRTHSLQLRQSECIQDEHRSTDQDARSTDEFADCCLDRLHEECASISTTATTIMTWQMWQPIDSPVLSGKSSGKWSKRFTRIGKHRQMPMVIPTFSRQVYGTYQGYSQHDSYPTSSTSI